MAGLTTPLTDRLGIEHPVVQAPIGSVSTPALAAAVSNAGGLGTLAVTWRDPEETREVIAETRAATDEPFGVNLVLDANARERPTREHLDVILDTDVDVVSFSFGDPAPYVQQVTEAGKTVVATVEDEETARRAIDAGVDVLVAQGWESGGHVQSEIATMPLVPQIADAAAGRDVPVVAAGGIGDGRGLAAALALGADGAWLGTRFVLAEEAAAHDQYQTAVVRSGSGETVFSTLFDKGWPGQSHRTLRNSAVSDWVAAGRPPSGQRPGEDDTVATGPDGEPVERYSDDPPLPGMDGDVADLPMYAGQSAGLTGEVSPAGEIVDELVAEATETIDGLADSTAVAPR